MTDIGIPGVEAAHRGIDWLSMRSCVRYLTLCFAPAVVIMLSIFVASLITEFILGYQPGDATGGFISRITAVILGATLLQVFIKIRNGKFSDSDHPSAEYLRHYEKLLVFPWGISAGVAAPILVYYSAAYLNWSFIFLDEKLYIVVTAIIMALFLHFSAYSRAIFGNSVRPARRQGFDKKYVPYFVASVAWSICFVLTAALVILANWVQPLSNQ